MKLLTNKKIKEILGATKTGKLKWEGSEEMELFSATYNETKLAIKYATKYYSVNNPVLILGINATKAGEKDNSQILNLYNKENELWDIVYTLWTSVVHSSKNNLAA